MNKPVLNVQWLNDILFGFKLSVKEPENIKYQQFDLCDPFLVNYDMVSHLMGNGINKLYYFLFCTLFANKLIVL